MPAQYRKYPSGKEFLRLINGQVVSVLITPKGVRVLASTNDLCIQDFNDDTKTLPSNSKEFSKAMSRAQYEITKND